MPTIKKKFIGDAQFGGFTPFGNLTSLRATLLTDAAGAVVNADSQDPIAVGDVVILEKLPAGFVLEDAQIIVSVGLTAASTGSLGFIYCDGVDDATVPQDAAYFGAALNGAAVARLRTASSKAPVKLAKEAFLIWTHAGADNAKAARLDVIVHGERIGPA